MLVASQWDLYTMKISSTSVRFGFSLFFLSTRKFFRFLSVQYNSNSNNSKWIQYENENEKGKKNYIIFVFFYRWKYIILFSLVFHFLSFCLIFASFFLSFPHVYGYIYSHLKSVDYFRLCIVYKEKKTSFSLYILRINTVHNGKNGKVWWERAKKAHTNTHIHNLFFPFYEWANI